MGIHRESSSSPIPILSRKERAFVVSKTHEYLKQIGGYECLTSETELINHACSTIMKRRDYVEISAVFCGDQDIGIWIGFRDLVNKNCSRCITSIVMDVLENGNTVKQTMLYPDKLNRDYHIIQ